MIRLSGFKPMDEKGLGDITIQFTGLRPGEKLYEELLIDEEKVEKTSHERILKSYEKSYEFEMISICFEKWQLSFISENTILNLYKDLEKYVDGYHHRVQD